MRIFLSYASEDRSVAEEVALALKTDGHQVFFDRDDLQAGEGFNQRIRDELHSSQMMVYLISPYSVKPGRYPLTELRFAQDRWTNPKGKILPVMIATTDYTHVPSYLKAVTILEPTGNIAAEVAALLSRRRVHWPNSGWYESVINALLIFGVIALLVYWFFPEPEYEATAVRWLEQLHNGCELYGYSFAEGDVNGDSASDLVVQYKIDWCEGWGLSQSIGPHNRLAIFLGTGGAISFVSWTHVSGENIPPVVKLSGVENGMIYLQGTADYDLSYRYLEITEPKVISCKLIEKEIACEAR